MTIRPLPMLAFAFCLFAVGMRPTSAENADDAKQLTSDVATLRECVKKENAKDVRNEDACIFSIAYQCIGEKQVPMAVSGCHHREQAAWDKILNDSYRVIRDGLDEDKKRDALRDMQRVWIDAQKRQCEFLYTFYEGSMANPMMAYCFNRETGRRALYLLGFAEEIKSWKK